MSTRAVLIALVVAIALGIGAWFTLNQTPKAPPTGVVPVGETVVDFDPATVQEIRVVPAAGDQGSNGAAGGRTTQVLTRDRATGRWRLRLDAPGSEGATWPVVASRARAALRLLADARATAEPEPDASVGDDATSVTLVFDDGSERTLRLAARRLGGNALVEVGPAAGADEDAAGGARHAIVGDTVHRAFTEPGPRAWRDTAVFAGFGGADGGAAQASRIRIESPQGALSLAKLEGRWRVMEPAAGPANPGEVVNLITTLDHLEITDFFDQHAPPTDPAVTGLDRPIASIALEADHRTLPADGAAAPGNVSVQTERMEVVLGGPADSSGTRLFASLGAGRPLVAVDATDLAQLKEPSAYIATHATQISAADVGAVELSMDPQSASGPTPPATRTQWRYRRGLDGWAEVLPGGGESLLAEPGIKDVMDVLAFLTSRPALSVRSTPPAAYRRLGEMSLLSLGESPLDVLEVGTAGPGTIVVRSGDVYRTFPTDRLPRLLERFAGEAERTAPRAPGDGGDPIK